MRHYEVIFMVHPDQNDNISNIINHYENIISVSKGKIHRLENWGRRQLAYPIKKLRKAYYVLMNIEVLPEFIDILEADFRFNEAVIRNMIIRVRCAVSEPSPIMRIQEQEESNDILNNMKYVARSHVKLQ
ncbi:30S ribosomal protein S6 [Blochmannia endosymbiont of Polyrhachis (Hedomyrma) turneri]|uniref:30S ribosomal protein S6 n=1 Tax=Blochmannia endosymbiont of Polyrhachis (Hedomyrma) turneri TaxID=1505596 RepID=UPI00061A69DC|nr:30S ribosomal protein S6 [Blochmannia endosymbiont of Polyrhachis (Hedomyrma) turneri]AKC59671.1 30S ribosomal protein S6 [Blochmannia endosymbiont of Polyrhachis (Hedomyrma) turneri]